MAGETLRPGGLELTRHGVQLMLAHGLGRGEAAPRVLDLGCGPGATARCLASLGMDCLGVDWNPGAENGPGDAGCATSPHEGDGNAEGDGAVCPAPAAGCEEGANRTAPLLVAGDVLMLPVRDESLDACLAECVLSLVDAKRALAESARVLKDDGLLLVTDLVLRPEAAGKIPDGSRPPRPGAGATGSSCLAGALFPWEWEDLLKEAGFEVLVREDHRKALARLVAELVWYDAAEELGGFLPGAGSCHAARGVYGYALFLARRRPRA